MAEPIQHGSLRAIRLHLKLGQKLCPKCADFERDRQQGYRIIRGRSKTVQISTIGLARILRGADPQQVLAAELGPRALRALVDYRRGEQRA